MTEISHGCHQPPLTSPSTRNRIRVSSSIDAGRLARHLAMPAGQKQTQAGLLGRLGRVNSLTPSLRTGVPGQVNRTGPIRSAKSGYPHNRCAITASLRSPPFGWVIPLPLFPAGTVKASARASADHEPVPAGISSGVNGNHPDHLKEH
jgi:hypothetical protein